MVEAWNEKHASVCAKINNLVTDELRAIGHQFDQNAYQRQASHRLEDTVRELLCLGGDYWPPQ